MLRVSRADEWLRRTPTRPDMSTHGDCVVIRSGRGPGEVWHGHGLVKRTVMRAGDFMYIPPGTPHLPVNRGEPPGSRPGVTLTE